MRRTRRVGKSKKRHSRKVIRKTRQQKRRRSRHHTKKRTRRGGWPEIFRFKKDRVQEHLRNVKKKLEGPSLFAGQSAKDEEAQGLLEDACENALTKTNMSPGDQIDALNAFKSYQEINATEASRFGKLLWIKKYKTTAIDKCK